MKQSIRKKRLWALLVPAIILLVSCNRMTVETDNLDRSSGICLDADTLFAVCPPADGGGGRLMTVVDGEAVDYIAADRTIVAPEAIDRMGQYVYVADSARLHVVDRQNRTKTIIPLPDKETNPTDIEIIGDLLLLTISPTGNILTLDLAASGKPLNDNFQLLTTIHGASALCYTAGRLFIATAPDSTSVAGGKIYYIDDFTNPTATREYIPNTGKYNALTSDFEYLYFADAAANAICRVSLTDTTLVEQLPLAITKPVRKIAVAANTIYIAG